MDASNEFRDVHPEAEDILYAFFGEKKVYTQLEVFEILGNVGSTPKEVILDDMLYYGFLGIHAGDQGAKYVYDLGYDSKKLAALKRKSSDCRYVLHPAFYPALEID